MSKVVRIAMVAGEASGDLLGAHLIAALKKELPDAVFFGIGGPQMQGKGLESWWPMSKLSVMGYWEALKHYREISGIRRQLKNACLSSARIFSSGLMRPISIWVSKPA
jgi:lipid-A-disaccharide synthase